MYVVALTCLKQAGLSVAEISFLYFVSSGLYTVTNEATCGFHDKKCLQISALIILGVIKPLFFFFFQEKEVNGIKFWCYHAGHVLGAAMFMIEIAGVKVKIWLIHVLTLAILDLSFLGNGPTKLIIM